MFENTENSSFIKMDVNITFILRRRSAKYFYDRTIVNSMRLSLFDRYELALCKRNLKVRKFNNLHTISKMWAQRHCFV